MSRKRSNVPRRYWKISLSATLAARLELHLYDPVHKKPRYGSRSKVLEYALEILVDKLESGELTLDDYIERD